MTVFQRKNPSSFVINCHFVDTKPMINISELPLPGYGVIHKNNETNYKFYRNVAFLMYTEMATFRPQILKAASKLKPHRGLGTRLPSSCTIWSLKRVLNCLWLLEQHHFSQLSRLFLRRIVEGRIFAPPEDFV